VGVLITHASTHYNLDLTWKWKCGLESNLLSEAYLYKR